MTPYLETAASESFKGVNDLVFAPSGNLYFTDQGQTGMQDPTGRIWKPHARWPAHLPNQHDPESEWHRGRHRREFSARRGDAPNQIWRVPLPASGLTTKVGIFRICMAVRAALTAWRWITAAISGLSHQLRLHMAAVARG